MNYCFCFVLVSLFLLPPPLLLLFIQRKQRHRLNQQFWGLNQHAPSQNGNNDNSYDGPIHLSCVCIVNFLLVVLAMLCPFLPFILKIGWIISPPSFISLLLSPLPHVTGMLALHNQEAWFVQTFATLGSEGGPKAQVLCKHVLNS